MDGLKRQRRSPGDQPGKRALIGWVLFDWATQPFYTLVVTFLPSYGDHHNDDGSGNNNNTAATSPGSSHKYAVRSENQHMRAIAAMVLAEMDREVRRDAAWCAPGVRVVRGGRMKVRG